MEIHESCTRKWSNTWKLKYGYPEIFTFWRGGWKRWQTSSFTPTEVKIYRYLGWESSTGHSAVKPLQLRGPFGSQPKLVRPKATHSFLYFEHIFQFFWFPIFTGSFWLFLFGAVCSTGFLKLHDNLYIGCRFHIPAFNMQTHLKTDNHTLNALTHLYVSFERDKKKLQL